MTTHAKPAPETPPAKLPERDAQACVVCGLPVEARLDSTCRVCSKPVHISWKQGEPESACSQVVNPLNCCGIAFVCNPCAEAEPLTPDV
ncbi:MAG: hypothetical protein IIC82_02015 [Chloroflexi bacterium]|nr:hypothetical protein [Chloroflexota bacterium]